MSSPTTPDTTLWDAGIYRRQSNIDSGLWFFAVILPTCNGALVFASNADGTNPGEFVYHTRYNDSFSQYEKWEGTLNVQFNTVTDFA